MQVYWQMPALDRTFIPWAMSRHPPSWGFCKGVARSFPPLQSSQEVELYGMGSSVLSPPQIRICVSEARPSHSSSAQPKQNLIISLWQSKRAEWDGWMLKVFVYQPEGWRTSAGLWWYSNLQRAWPAKTQQQRQEVRWPLMPTGQIKQCKRGSGGNLTMALFSWMFWSRFWRLWVRPSSLSSSSSFLPSCCVCFILRLPLPLWGGVSWPASSSSFSCGPSLAADSLLTGNLRSRNK